MTDSTSHVYRYERKFVVSQMAHEQVECVIKFHPALFSESFPQRFVNNIYFDSSNFMHFYDNIEGNARRKKVRIRWYGEMFGDVLSPVLEMKIKSGHLGRKLSFPLPSFEITREFTFRTLVNAIENSTIPKEVGREVTSLNPVLLNSYSRKYFRSADGNFRITLDTDLVFLSINRQKNAFLKRVRDPNVIVELKYLENLDQLANRISGYLPFRLSKNSKYVTGIGKLFGNVG